MLSTAFDSCHSPLMSYIAQAPQVQMLFFFFLISMLQGIQNNLLPHAAMISGCPSSFSRRVQDIAQKGKPSMTLQHLSKVPTA